MIGGRRTGHGTAVGIELDRLVAVNRTDDDGAATGFRRAREADRYETLNGQRNKAEPQRDRLEHAPSA